MTPEVPLPIIPHGQPPWSVIPQGSQWEAGRGRVGLPPPQFTPKPQGPPPRPEQAGTGGRPLLQTWPAADLRPQGPT